MIEIALVASGYIILIFLGIFIFNFKWCINCIRDIASPKNHGGYTKLVQILFIVMLISVFILIVVYYFYSNSKVDKIDVILTVVVGWLGLIIGSFFGEKSMEQLNESRKVNTEKLVNKIDRLSFLNRKYREIIEEHKDEILGKK